MEIELILSDVVKTTPYVGTEFERAEVTILKFPDNPDSFSLIHDNVELSFDRAQLIKILHFLTD